MSQLVDDQANGKYDQTNACKDQYIPQDGAFGFFARAAQPAALALPRYANDDKQDTTYCCNNFMKDMMHIIRMNLLI